MYETWVGQKVQKHSGKPFKSKSKVNTVKGLIEHPQTQRPAFTFVEDDSYCEAQQCAILPEGTVNG